MIRLHESGQTLVTAGSWDELYELPGFSSDVNPSNVKLEEIIGSYSLSPKHPCGLKTCRQPHNRGYVVKVTDGLTNVGNVCGAKHFGVDFKTSKTIFRAASNAAKWRERVGEVQQQVPGVEKRIQNLREGEYGADKTYRLMHRYMTALFDERTIERLKERGKRGDNQVADEIALTAEEREVSGGENFRRETIFTIAGVRAVCTYRKISPTNFKNLGNELYEFANADADSADNKALKQHYNFAKGVDHTVTELQEILEDCRRFLVEGNIALIQANKVKL